MLQHILQFFSATLPHTSARLGHWVFLLSDQNPVLLDLQTVAFAFLPLIIYELEDQIGYVPYSGGHSRPFHGFAEALAHWACFSAVCRILSDLSIIQQTPGLRNRLVLATDLYLEFIVILAVHVVFCLCVALLVDTAFGSPFLVRQAIFFITVVQLLVLGRSSFEEQFNLNPGE